MPVPYPAVGKAVCTAQGQRNQSFRALWPQLLAGDEPGVTSPCLQSCTYAMNTRVVEVLLCGCMLGILAIHCVPLAYNDV